MQSDRGASVETEPLLLSEQHDDIELLILNRAKQRNSLSLKLIEELSAAFARIANDQSVKVVVLAANGPAFCAGHDLKELLANRSNSDGGRAFYEKVMIACCNMMKAIVELPQPVIASVQGVATAAGCQLVASCDLAVASESAKFATPGVDIGLFCSTPMVALSRNVSRKHALEMLYTGEMLSAEDAYRIGLINRIVEKGSEQQEAEALAKKIAAKSSQALRIGKRAFYKQLEMNLAEAYEFTARVMVDNLMARDADEGICAFIEKRQPNW